MADCMWAGDELPESAELLRSLVCTMLSGVAYCKLLFENGKPTDFVYLMVNDAYTTLTGLKDVVGKKVSKVVPGILESAPDLLERYARVALTGQPERFEGYSFSAQKRFMVSAYSAKPEHFFAVLHDITDLKNTEARATRLTDIYHALSATNAAIIKSRSKEKLFQCVCQVAVEYGQMQHAWIGLPNAEGRFVAAARYGRFSDFERQIVIRSTPDTPEGTGPSSIAHREGRHVIVNDTLNDPLVAPWHDALHREGVRALATFPVRRGGGPYAVLSLYSDQIGVFDDEIVRLLKEIADNVSFALDNLDREAWRSRAEVALRESENRFRTLFRNTPLPYHSLDIEGNILEVSDRWLSLLGYAREEVIGRFFGDFVSDESVTQPAAEFPRFRSANMIEGAMFEMICKDGSRRLWVVDGQIARDGEGNFLHTHCIYTDITERHRAEEQLRLAGQVFEQSSEGMMVTDVNDVIIAVNPAFEQITGYQADEVIGKRPNVLKSGRHGKEFYQSMWKSINDTGRWKGEIWNRTKSGEEYIQQITINTSYNPDGSVLRRVALFSDITEKKLSEDLIWTQANFDALTGLPNRRLFRDHLQQEIRKSRRTRQPLALFLMDLDGFKDVNDTLGHDMGDLLLKEAAERLRRCVRDIDTVARLGGDEFTVILTELHDPSNADRVARHILENLSNPFTLGEDLAHVSASIGITFFPDDATEVEDLIRNADQAMYVAKQEGKNRYHYFTPEMQQAALRRMRIINDMRSALNSNQFEILYQPIVELSTGFILKAEALIRWRHPRKGLINPVEFITAAEDTGMISAFGDWVFHEAARQAAIWREKYHPDFQISVNISPVQFKKEGIDPAIWLEHLKGLDLPGQGIVVEITEGLLLDANPKVTEQLLMLRDAGIEVALDDFGTGYSSLAYLKKFDIDYLKIDRVFVQNLTIDSDDMALCEAIIVMAHKLGLRVVAEGIETDSQRSLLANAGCDFAQGYLFSKPVPAGEFERLVDADPIPCR